MARISKSIKLHGLYFRCRGSNVLYLLSLLRVQAIFFNLQRCCCCCCSIILSRSLVIAKMSRSHVVVVFCDSFCCFVCLLYTFYDIGASEFFCRHAVLLLILLYFDVCVGYSVKLCTCAVHTCDNKLSIQLLPFTYSHACFLPFCYVLNDSVFFFGRIHSFIRSE